MKYFIWLLLTLITFGFTNKSTVNNSKDFCLYVFEGSDWCANCMRLENKVLHSYDFLKILDSNKIELVRVDFPQRKKLSKEQKNQNKHLAVKYKFEGVFPSLVLSRADSLLYEKIIYQNQTIDEFLKQILEVKNKLN